jgi:hypothetical protein
MVAVLQPTHFQSYPQKCHTFFQDKVIPAPNFTQLNIYIYIFTTVDVDQSVFTCGFKFKITISSTAVYIYKFNRRKRLLISLPRNKVGILRHTIFGLRTFLRTVELAGNFEGSSITSYIYPTNF